MNIKKLVTGIVSKHGSYRKAALATGVSSAQLHKLATGQQTNPTVSMLRKLGLL